VPLLGEAIPGLRVALERRCRGREFGPEGYSSEPPSGLRGTSTARLNWATSVPSWL
jgi:hypothetical protein